MVLPSCAVTSTLTVLVPTISGMEALAVPDGVKTPFTFTVTRLSQIATFYYFFFFLVLLPVLGLRETPGRVPDTIAKPVTKQAQGAA